MSNIFKVGSKAIYYGDNGGNKKADKLEMDRVVIITEILNRYDKTGHPDLYEISFNNGWFKAVMGNELKKVRI